MIDSTININNGSVVIHVTWIYGSTNWNDRLQLWDKLRIIARTRSTSWMCVGDFNEIAIESEKEGGRPKPPQIMEAFNSMMQDTRLVDLGYKEQHFTWCNNWEGSQRIK